MKKIPDRSRRQLKRHEQNGRPSTINPDSVSMLGQGGILLGRRGKTILYSEAGVALTNSSQSEI